MGVRVILFWSLWRACSYHRNNLKLDPHLFHIFWDFIVTIGNWWWIHVIVNESVCFCRMSDKKVVTTDRPKPRPIVSANSYAKAMEGLHNILSCSNQSPLLSLLDLSHSNLSSNQSENSLQTLEPSSESQSGLFFVSLLNDYLSHYIEMMNCYVERGQSLLSPQSSSSSSFGPSSSLDSSTGSLTSSLNVLLRDGAAYANTLESQALCALNILHKLVLYCDAVRDTLLYSDDVLSDSSISSFGKVCRKYIYSIMSRCTQCVENTLTCIHELTIWEAIKVAMFFV